MDAAFSLDDPERPLRELLAALGLVDTAWSEDLDEVQVAADTQADPVRAGNALEALKSAAASYDRALTAKLRFEYPPAEPDADLETRRRAGRIEELALQPGLGAAELKTFLSSLPSGVPLILDLTLNKRAVAESGLTPVAGSRPALVFRTSHLAALLQREPQDLEAWWDAQNPAKLVILAPEWKGFLNGRYLAVVGGGPEAGWKRATASLGLNPELSALEVYQTARKCLWWQNEFVRHLTPLHLQVEGDAPAGDPVADAVRAQFTNLWLLFTADRSEVGSGPRDWVSIFSREGHSARVVRVRPDSVLDPEELAGIPGLKRLLGWAYADGQRFDQLSFLQIAVARALYQSAEGERFGLLLRQGESLWTRIQQDWKLFIEGRLDAFNAQVRALEDDVAGTVRSLSEQIGGLIKGLSDTMLAAVGVLLSGFIATLFKYDLRAEILGFAVTLYALYVFAFPLIYNMTEKWQSYRALIRLFDARRLRFEKVLPPARVSDIVDDPVRRGRGRFRRWFVAVVATYLTVLLLLWLLVPSPIDSVAFRAPAGWGMKGPFRANTALRSARVVGEGELLGAEDVAVDPQGRLYTGTADGRVMRITLRPGGGDLLDTYAETGGRPLGVRFGPDQKTLFVADANKGLLAIDSGGGVQTLATAADGVPFRFTNDLDVAPDGTIYFSDASSRFGIADYLEDLLDARPHGRLLVYGKDRAAHVLLGGLVFANGVALSQGGDFVLVVETYRYRIRRYWLAGRLKGTSDIFLDGLPGFPDNLSRDPVNGHFWVALYTVRNPALDFLHPHPWLKNQLAKLPRFLWPKPEPYGLIFEVDAAGHVLRSLQDPGGWKVRHITSVEPSGANLYLGSLDGPVAVVSRPKAP